jgi:hypothetical protein
VAVDAGNRTNGRKVPKTDHEIQNKIQDLWLGTRFLSRNIVQMIDATTPTQALAPNATPSFPSSRGQVRLTQSTLSGSENTNPGKKNPIPRSTGITQPLLSGLRPEAENRRECIPTHSAATAIEHIRSSPRTLGQNGMSGFPKSLNISNAYPRGRTLPNTATAPRIPAIMRLAISVTTILPGWAAAECRAGKGLRKLHVSLDRALCLASALTTQVD